MIIHKYKDIRLEFTPLENGKNEYLVSLHDYGNLEVVVSRTIDGQTLNELINIIESGKYPINFLRYL